METSTLRLSPRVAESPLLRLVLASAPTSIRAHHAVLLPGPEMPSLVCLLSSEFYGRVAESRLRLT
jgi:hypothetical protein